MVTTMRKIAVSLELTESIEELLARVEKFLKANPDITKSQLEVAAHNRAGLFDRLQKGCGLTVKTLDRLNLLMSEPELINEIIKARRVKAA